MQEQILKRIDEAVADIQNIRTYFKARYGEESLVDKKIYEALLLAKEEIQRYRAMEERLRVVYGDCPGLLEKVVETLIRHECMDIPEPVKARLLTDDDVDKWEAYKAIGTVDKCKAAVEKQISKKPRFYTHNWYCTDCGRLVGNSEFKWANNFCKNCGQKLDWGKDNE